MIVRAILQDPTIADNFDHFNDYDNTRNWLLCLDPSDERDVALARLDVTHQRYRVQDAIRFQTPTFLREINLKDPYDINCGACEEFAMKIIDRLGGESETLCMVWVEDLKDTPDPDASHAVISLKYLDDQWMYFDAECPKGTLDPAEIPCIANKGVKREDVIAKRGTHWFIKP